MPNKKDVDDLCTISKEALREALTSEDMIFGLKLHVLRQYHYQETGNHLTENIATALIRMVNDQQDLTMDEFINLCTVPNSNPSVH
jgi:Ca2+-binding EF-hand superfamily protein